MPSLAKLLLICTGAALATAQTLSFHVIGDEKTSWPKILSAAGLRPSAGDPRGVYVIPSGVAVKPGPWEGLVQGGALLILEGESELAASFGIRPTSNRIEVRNVLDQRRPKLPIVWERIEELAVFEVPEGARVFARERWQGAPLVVGLKRGEGAVLWIAAPPGLQGYERFPYLLHALVDLGLEPPFRSGRLWAFLDTSYRTRVDVEYIAERWRRSGYGAMHVAAWHYWEPDAERDAWFRRLINACHRRAISVYAWVELPHVSERFWQDHPEWREKTAILQDAHLDWRKLMNLTNRDCFREVTIGLRSLTERFDWDGINLAELYFESLEGAANPARFTPFNDDVRRMFREATGLDAYELFRAGAPANQDAGRKFLEFRADLARRMQEEWLAELNSIRRSKPDLDLVLTHVDDRFDTHMRDLIGADAARLLPLLDRYDFTFLIEDPATVWHLGPQRYPEIAARYQPLTPHKGKLAIDINVVERYQDVYPTKQQTGTELFQLVNIAGKAFPRVALYFESSVAPEDVALLSSAAAGVMRAERTQGKLLIDSPYGTGIPWRGDALVNGRLWPVVNGETLWLAAGAHTVEPSTAEPPMRLLDFQGTLRAARVRNSSIEFAYESQTRALAIVDKLPKKIEIDGAEAAPRALPAGKGHLLYLPRGQHLVTLWAATPPPTD